MLGIIILNYNTWNETRTCIETIKKHVRKLDYKIYLVDNNSPKQLDDVNREFFNGVENLKMIFAKENKGYAAGNNYGLKAALEDDCSEIMICNSDIEFVDDSVEKMVEYLYKLDAGIIGPQVYNSKDVLQPFYMKCELTGIGKIKNMFLKTKFRRFFKHFEDSLIYRNELKEPMQMFGTSGCCFVMSNECAKFLTPLDENTFLYEEEYIIGYRLKGTKFKVYVVPETHVIHNHSVSIGGLSKFSYQCLIDSEQYYLKEYVKSPLIMRWLLYVIRKIKLSTLK